ncbi:hypothetical protein VSDG_09508 [Cytospora chrysosperma]|uniref:Rhamnogalacturonase A/B/Epimerase-like pectate lyase domain-containing protein n=1 Tax=Cytospora chrysosperma TaxID=252740 RepID=A0A423VCJ2_CYTCH|nr:hypothetical protein VSDG_09508 [Valsa sordida]
MKSMMKPLAVFIGSLACVSASPAHPQLQNKVQSRATSFWYANMDHTGSARGYAPDLDGDYTYPVYKAVDSGDADALQGAINDDGISGNQRNSQWLASEPRVVYIPPGTYTLSQTLNMSTDTILMGDATNPPTIKAAAGFSGDILIRGQDPATGIMGELSFAVGLKNLILDTTAIGGGVDFTALQWGVAQACQLQNVRITMPSSVGGTGHTGVMLNRGSTLTVADARIERGQYGIWHNGHQQVLYKGIYFYENTIGLRVTGGNTISLVGPTWDTCGYGILVDSGYPWVAVIDGTSVNSGVTFTMNEDASFMIENLSKDTSSAIAVGPSGTLLGGQSHVYTFTYGNTVGGDPIYGPVSSSNIRPSTLAPGGKYPVLSAPNYASNTVLDFINVKDPNQNGGKTVYGDNTRDESGVLNSILQYAAGQGKIAYFPFGKYRVDDTLFVPVGSRIVGEAWATITGNGKNFQDSSHPRPVVQVGNAGDVGTAQIQDMRFTVSDVLPGAIILQFNMAGSQPGDVALWNSLVTIGGTRGADALAAACTDPSNECRAAFLGIHLAATSSVYIENVWNWVSDHFTESSAGGHNIAAKGGMLVEATAGGTWLHGLGSEHFWLYQLNLRKASNVVVTLLQSETNYDQGIDTEQAAPAPWTADPAGWGDPDMGWCSDNRCRMGYANYINGGSNIYTYASASWVFYSGPGISCGNNGEVCQDYMHWIESTPSNLQSFGLTAKNTQVALRLADATDIQTSPDFTGSWGTSVGRYTP